MIWACPVCQSPLVQVERLWRCDNNHCFDIAKEGYSNLLLANQKRSLDPGDSKEMMVNRRGFLAAGYYQSLADKLVELLSSLLSEKAALLDSGCGEGYYLTQVAEGLNEQGRSLALFGIDISKDAVKLASREFKHLQISSSSFAVASSFNLPVLDKSVDAVLRIFAPGDPAEVKRVLKPDGHLLLVTPGPRHLFALKQLVYREAVEHEDSADPEGFELAEECRVGDNISLQNNDAVQQLLAMTPFYWKASANAREQVGSLQGLDTEIDFVIRTYRPV